MPKRNACIHKQIFLFLNSYFHIHPQFLFLMSYQNNLSTLSHFRKLVVLGQMILRNNVGLEQTPDETN